VLDSRKLRIALEPDGEVHHHDAVLLYESDEHDDTDKRVHENFDAVGRYRVADEGAKPNRRFETPLVFAEAYNPPMNRIAIDTTDGTCPSYVFRPQAGDHPWPAVLVFMDGLGIRPAMLEIGERLSTNGFFVLLPDLFYRSGPYAPMNPHTVFTDPEQRKILMETFIALATPANIMADTRAFLDYLAGQHDVKLGGIGTTGYCMGGLMSLTAAGTYPDRIVAAASYHGGRLATDASDSPHRLAPNMKARIYVAGAIEDQSFPDDMKARLEAALTDAGVDHTIETYPAKHGWVLRDTPVYDAAAAERHWQTLVGLLHARL
jgi:carboxymethylenebutenolidase